MLKGYRKINKYLTDWCKQHGFKLKCRLGTDFQYDSEEQTIYYTFVVTSDHDKLFMDLCKQYLTELEKCDNFILSFFHEIGHYMTEDEFADDEWDDYYKFLTKEFPDENKFTLDDYVKYYMHPIELEATIWGCEYINQHMKEVKEFIDGLTPLIMNFYKINKVEIDA